MDAPTAQQITTWLADWRQGDAEAGNRLFEAIHPELHRLAARAMAGERRNHSLDPTALVNEAYLRLMGGNPVTFNDRVHFLAIAARTMRRILIDHARAHVAAKRGGDQERVGLSAVAMWNAGASPEEILALDAALTKLEGVDARGARVVELRFFGGLQESEVAEELGVSTITVKRDWKTARAWLIAQLQPHS